jgi:signal transduction histidine kinase
MGGKQTLLPYSERGAFKQIMGGFCAFLVGIVVLYYGNLYVQHITSRLEGRDFGPVLFGASFRVLIQGSQVSLLLLGWVLIGRGVGSYFSRVELAVNLILSSVGIGVNWAVLPLFSEKLTYNFPLNIFTVILLVMLFQLLTLQVENGIDTSAAMLLWVYSFQSLDLLPAFPTNRQTMPLVFQVMYRTSENVAIASMAGTALFLSFMAGALTSTWLLARYSIRLRQVRQLWEEGGRKANQEEDGLRKVSMVDMRSLVHDLKNPLAAVKGMALMLRDGKPGDKVSEKAEIMLKAANYMEHMIGEILHEDQRHRMTVELFFDNLERHIRPFPWGEYVSVTIEPEAEKLTVALNEIRFTRALLNILDNAWRANRLTGMKDIALHVRSNAELLEIEVLDNGPGYVARSVVYQKSGWGSTGLGLAFVRKVVVAHGGELLLSQRKDRMAGTSILVSLPAVAPLEP